MQMIYNLGVNSNLNNSNYEAQLVYDSDQEDFIVMLKFPNSERIEKTFHYGKGLGVVNYSFRKDYVKFGFISKQYFNEDEVFKVDYNTFQHVIEFINSVYCLVLQSEINQGLEVI